jgi:hypothetical protein
MTSPINNKSSKSISTVHRSGIKFALKPRNAALAVHPKAVLLRLRDLLFSENDGRISSDTRCFNYHPHISLVLSTAYGLQRIMILEFPIAFHSFLFAFGFFLSLHNFCANRIIMLNLEGVTPVFPVLSTKLSTLVLKT